MSADSSREPQGPHAGDERNTRFELTESRKDAAPGFEDDEEPALAQGHRRFPRRMAQEEIPQESLAQRMRAGREEG